MINIKVSLPSHGNGINFNNFIDSEDGSTKNIRFFINEDIPSADGWLVFEDLKFESEKCSVPEENIIYLNNETSYKKNHFFEDHMVEFIKQFKYTFGCYPQKNESHTNTLPFLPWMVHANHGDSIYENTSLNYKHFANNEYLDKSLDLSVICSNKKVTENHALRFEFLTKLKNHFNDRLVWFGNGINQIERKIDVISKSKYHLVIENDSKYNLVSEKLFDAYLGNSFPIYYGANNIHEIFDKSSLKLIDINNFEGSIKIIENILSSNLYEDNIESIYESKQKVLNEYNFYTRINSIVNTHFKDIRKSSNNITLHSTQYFWKNTVSKKKQFKKVLRRNLRLDF